MTATIEIGAYKKIYCPRHIAEYEGNPPAKMPHTFIGYNTRIQHDNTMTRAEQWECQFCGRVQETNAVTVSGAAAAAEWAAQHG